MYLFQNFYTQRLKTTSDLYKTSEILVSLQRVIIEINLPLKKEVSSSLKR